MIFRCTHGCGLEARNSLDRIRSGLCADKTRRHDICLVRQFDFVKSQFK